MKMNDVTRELLKKISEGKTLDSIAKELDMRESTLHARVDSFIHQGYIAEIKYDSSCSMCPLNCNSKSSCDSGIKAYAVTDKGVDCIKSVQKET